MEAGIELANEIDANSCPRTFKKLMDLKRSRSSWLGQRRTQRLSGFAQGSSPARGCPDQSGTISLLGNGPAGGFQQTCLAHDVAVAGTQTSPSAGARPKVAMDKKNRMVQGQHRERFQASLERLFVDVETMRADRAALDAIAGLGLPYQFLRQARTAFQTDRLIRLVRVLEDSGNSASFWYLDRCEPALIRHAVVDAGLDMSKLQDLKRFAGPAKLVRDKVFAHVDKDAVLDPEATYIAAGISLSELAQRVEDLWSVLTALYRSAFPDKYRHRPSTGEYRDLFDRELRSLRPGNPTRKA